MSYLSDFLNFPALIAKAAVNLRDLVLFGPLGKACPAVTVDYAVVANVGTAIVAQTQIGNGTQKGRACIVRDTDGTIYAATTNSGANGCCVYKYSITGALLGSLIVNAAASDVSPFKMVRLSNGTFAVAYLVANVLTTAIFDNTLTLLYGPTTFEAIVGPADKTDYYDMIALSGGGFALSWNQSGGTTNVRMAIRSNANVAVLATATVGSVTSATDIMTSMAQLSSGNIAVAINVTSGGVTGGYHLIVTAAGVSVLAITLLLNSGANSVPYICAMTGYYCILWSNGTVKAYVINDAGVTQGTGLSLVTGASVALTAGTFRGKLMTDNTQFVFTAPLNATNANISVLLLQVTGANNYTVADTGLAWGATTVYTDAFIDTDSGLLVYFKTNSGTTQNQFGTFDYTTNRIVAPLTVYGAVPTTNGGSTISAVSAGGDFAFIGGYNYTSVAGMYFTVAKFADHAIAGVSLGTAAAGATVALAETAGTYGTNPLKGGAAKAFDHTTGTNIQGNKGTVTANGATLRGV